MTAPDVIQKRNDWEKNIKEKELDADAIMGLDYHTFPVTENNESAKKKSKNHMGFNWQQTRRTVEKTDLSEGDITNINSDRRIICIDNYSIERFVDVAGPVTY